MLKLNETFIKPRYGESGFAGIPACIENAFVSGNYDAVVLFLIDGFGWRFYERFQDAPFIKRIAKQGKIKKLISQFPSTTAAHVTTLHTGLNVGQSGVHEWYYYEPQADAIIAPLLFSYAGGRKIQDTLKASTIQPASVYPQGIFYPKLKKLGVEPHVFGAQEYTPSTYSDTVMAGAKLHSFKTLSEALTNIGLLIEKQTKPTYVNLYFDMIDAISHEYVPTAPQTEAEIQTFLLMLEYYFERIFNGKKRVLFLMTADHGQVEIDPKTTIYLNTHPSFKGVEKFIKTNRNGQLLIPAGSARDMFLYIHDEMLDEAQSFLTKQLEGRADVVKTEALIHAGYFGPEVSSRFHERVGNLVVLPYRYESVWWYEKNKFEQRFHGHHGGLTPQEMGNNTILVRNLNQSKGSYYMKIKKVWLGGLVTVLVLLSAWLAYDAINSIGFFKPKPNIIFILTDDLDFTLMPYLPNVDQLLTKQGASFTNYFVTSPLCCPSRASMLRGQYPHNTNILENTPGFINFYKNGREAESLAPWLNKAGYKTAMIGKYLNGYPVNAGKHYVPPGWTDWHAFMNQYDSETGTHYYYNYVMNENGKLVTYGEDPKDYSTDVLAGRAYKFINASIKARSPFFLYLSLKAPHGPSIGAPRHLNMDKDLQYPLKPSFQEADVNDKPSTTIALARGGDDFDVYDANALFVKRVQSMLSVDEMVGQFVQVLKQTGQLDNTYIIFTSDNGFHMGEHGLPAGKDYPYEEDLHVPFIVRGPGIQPNTQIAQMTANIDIAPTIADMAQFKHADFIDGRSWMPFLHPQAGAAEPTWRKSLLIETGYADDKTAPLVYRGIRAETFIYLEYRDGELEYYDLVHDPYELNNIANKLDTTTLASLHAWLEQLKACKAESCRTAEVAVPDNLKTPSYP